MEEQSFSRAVELCADQWQQRQHVDVECLRRLADAASASDRGWLSLQRAFEIFNGSDLSVSAIRKAAEAGDSRALETADMLSDYLPRAPYGRIKPEEYRALRDQLDRNPDSMFDDNDWPGYPYYVPGRTYLYEPSWVHESLEQAQHKFSEFCRESRSSDTAILVGNGPSLNKSDLSALDAQDVFVSNYAIKHERLGQLAKAVAVSNYLVAEQEPYRFLLDDGVWKFFPFWLRNSLIPDERTVFLNAQGGELFCSSDALRRVAWHSTVSYFWLQILYSAGYRKVLMIGFDHSYRQEESAKEGDVLLMKDADQNHFDESYFRGKKWQAADVGRMEQAYLLAKQMFEADGREIVNCTIGGKLEVFRRSSVEAELSKPTTVNLSQSPARQIRVAVVTPFWEGDVDEAERHWRLLSRLGCSGQDHYHLFKHSRDRLPAVTMPNVICADVEKRYPEECRLPHPAGPNLMFLYTLNLLRDSGYTHFFWLEPDCVPTSKDWLQPFIDSASSHPNEPIVGTGGGTTVPGRKHWKHHFAGCSLYNIAVLGDVDFDVLLGDQIDVSFDVWLSVNLGFISLRGINDGDQINTIIFGDHRYDWELVQQPPSLVESMFEHWRPGKFLTDEQLWKRTKHEQFSLFHAIKNQDIVRKIFSTRKKSATSIIINYNNGPYIDAAISSALCQQDLDDIDYQVIVADDGSTDESAEIIRSYGDRVTALFLEHGKRTANFNQQRALKEAMAAASGDVVLLLDGDDLFDPKKVATMVRRFDDPDVVVGQHVLRRVDAVGDDIGSPMHVVSGDTTELTVDLYLQAGRCNYFQPTSGLAFRRCYLEKAIRWLRVDGFPNTWLDVRLTRLAPLYGKAVSLPWPLGSWRRHERSDSIKDDDLQERLREHHDWFNVAAAEFGIFLDYENSEQNARLARLRRVLTMPRGKGAHFDETQLISRLLSSRKGEKYVMLDVGAHVGTSAAFFDALGWRIYCFEPDAANRKQLAARFRGKRNITIDSRAVSSEEASGVPFFASPESTGISGLLAFRSSHAQVGSVDVTTLSRILDEHSIEHVDFLKIDVEGHDLGVLKGVPWDRITPDVVECEFEDAKTVHLGHTWRDVCQFLVAKGYAVYVSEWHPIRRYGVPHDWHTLRRFPCDLSDERAWGNVLAFRRDPGLTRISEVLESLLRFRSAAESGPREVSNSEQQDIEPGSDKVGRVDSSQHEGQLPGQDSEARRQAMGWRFYAPFGEYLRRQIPALYQLGRIVMWALRFSARHKRAVFGGVLIGLGMILAPIVSQSLSSYAPFFWAAGALLLLASSGIVLGAAVRQLGLRLATVHRELQLMEDRLQRKSASELQRQLASFRDESLGEIDEKIFSVSARVESKVDRGYGRLEKISMALSELEGCVDSYGERLESYAANLDAMAQREHGLTKEIVDFNQQSRAELAEAESRTRHIEERVREIEAEMDQKRREEAVKPASRSPASYQTFNRVFTNRERDVILTKWQPLLDVPLTPSSVAYIAERVALLEQLMMGRLASSLEDAVLRIAVSLSVKNDRLSVLEIGTLFGIGLAMIYERARSRFDSVYLAAIDPMEGYYGDNAADILTGEAVSSSVFRENMRRAGVRAQDVTLIRGYSTESAVREAAAERTYDVLIIDGDHSYEGVKGDFDQYIDLVLPGGYVVIDDYGNKDWPEVTRFVDEEVVRHPAVAHVGTSWRTAVFRRL